METWILIAYLQHDRYSSAAGGPLAQEFNSRATCETAIDEIAKMVSWEENFDIEMKLPKGERHQESWAICVKK